MPTLPSFDRYRRSRTMTIRRVSSAWDSPIIEHRIIFVNWASGSSWDGAMNVPAQTNCEVTKQGVRCKGLRGANPACKNGIKREVSYKWKLTLPWMPIATVVLLAMVVIGQSQVSPEVTSWKQVKSAQGVVGGRECSSVLLIVEVAKRKQSRTKLM